MTEEQWLTSTSLDAMLEHLRRQCRVAQRKAGRRKVRLFACGCVRRAWHLLSDERSRQAVLVAERYADGLADEDEAIEAVYQASAAEDELGWPSYAQERGRAPAGAMSATRAACWAVMIDLPVLR